MAFVLDAWEWGLARIGNHPFSDGRSRRHRGQGAMICLCTEAGGSLDHVLFSCPGVADLRSLWRAQAGWDSCNISLGTGMAPTSFDEIRRRVFDPSDTGNSAASVAAHVTFASACCIRFRNALSRA